jgi:hypothetical protein
VSLCVFQRQPGYPTDTVVSALIYQVNMSNHYSKGSSRHKQFRPSNTFEGSNEMKGSYYTYHPEQQAVDQYQEKN